MPGQGQGGGSPRVWWGSIGPIFPGQMDLVGEKA